MLYIESTGNIIPSIVIAINNIAVLSELYEDYLDAISYLMREGMRYGIYFVVTATSSRDFKYGMAGNFKQQYVLQLNDDSDYSTYIGKTDGLFPHHNKGRGLISINKKIYEYQTAFVVHDEKQQNHHIVGACEALAASWNGERATRVPILPEEVSIEFLSSSVTPHSLKLPVGVDKTSLQIVSYPFEEYFITTVLSNEVKLCSQFGSGLAKLTAQCVGIHTTFIDMSDSTREYLDNTVKYYGGNMNWNDIASWIYQLALKRHNEYKTSIENGEAPKTYEEELIFINGFKEFYSHLTDQGAEMIRSVFAICQNTYNLHFVVLDSPRGFSDSKMAHPFDPDKKDGSWYKKMISGNDGIWLGNGIIDQNMLYSGITSTLPIPNDFGYIVINNKAISCSKMLNELREDADNE